MSLSNVFSQVFGRLLGAFFMALMLASSPLMAAGGGFFDENFGNLKEELATAKQEGKAGVFLFFEMDECPGGLNFQVQHPDPDFSFARSSATPLPILARIYGRFAGGSRAVSPGQGAA